MSDGALHSGRVIHIGGLEGRAAAGIEPAEELIELEPQRLDADEDSFGKSIVFVGMAEGIAIYGLLIAIVILLF